MHGVTSRLIYRGRPGESAQRPSSQSRDGSRLEAPATVKDVEIAIAFLGLLGVLLVSALLMLFSWVTAGLPPSLLATCPRVEDCATPVPAQYPTLAGDNEPREENPALTP